MDKTKMKETTYYTFYFLNGFCQRYFYLIMHLSSVVLKTEYVSQVFYR